MLESFQNKFNEKYEQNKAALIPLFHLEDRENFFNDIQMDGYYDYIKNQFVETLFSPYNVKVDNYVDSTSEKKPSDEDTTTKLPDPNPPPTLSPTATPPPPPPYVKKETNKEQAYRSLYYIDFKIKFNEKMQDDNYTQYDFVDVMNIGTGAYQNDPKQYQNKWLRRLDFYIVWDRKPFKIYSSIAEQSNRGYIGNSEVEYSPIKYYKLNSTDQRFWIDFFSSAYHDMPIKLPKNETFCIEMQLLPYNKNII